LDTKPDMLASSPGRSHVCGFAAERGHSKFLTRLKFLESQLITRIQSWLVSLYFLRMPRWARRRGFSSWTAED